MNAPNYGLQDYDRPLLNPPKAESKVFVHSCCAPCAGEVLLALKASDLQLTVFFYNPNIHPQKEYLLRKDEAKRQCESLAIPYLDGDYDVQRWFAKTEGFEQEPERGQRCTLCFDMRFEVTARQAVAQGFNVFTSTLGISRWKDMQQINQCGHQVAEQHPNLMYWDFNWRKQGGSQRMIELSKQEQYYQQEYCGCVYSLRDTNRARAQRGLEKIKIGTQYYGHSEQNG